MRVVCVFRKNTDYARSVNEWLEGFYRQTGHNIEVIDPDKNINFCETYDVVEYPTMLAIDNIGSVRASWRGKELPLFNEVLYYMI